MLDDAGMSKASRSRDRTDSNGADIKLAAPPLPTLDRPAAAALLALLRRAVSETQAELQVAADDERVRS